VKMRVSETVEVIERKKRWALPWPVPQIKE
jgi:hypothetical protein